MSIFIGAKRASRKQIMDLSCNAGFLFEHLSRDLKQKKLPYGGYPP